MGPTSTATLEPTLNELAFPVFGSLGMLLINLFASEASPSISVKYAVLFFFLSLMIVLAQRAFGNHRRIPGD